MLIGHFSEAIWNAARWPNFSPSEFACPHCGEFWFDARYFDAIQKVRRDLEQAIKINSAHRCIIHNRIVGGALRSEHKRIALDISTRRQDRHALLRACLRAGFTTFGFYGTFLHTDLRPGRVWITSSGKTAWNGLVTYSASGRVLHPAVSLASQAA